MELDIYWLKNKVRKWNHLLGYCDSCHCVDCYESRVTRQDLPVQERASNTRNGVRLPLGARNVLTLINAWRRP